MKAIRVANFELNMEQTMYPWCPQRLKCGKESAANLFREFEAWKIVWLLFVETNQQEKR